IIGNAEGKRLEVGKPRAELLPLFHMRDGALQTELGAPERAGGDVEAPAVERAHGDLEAVALGADAVGERDAASFEYDHGSRLRVPAELLFLRPEAQSGRAAFDDKARNAVRPSFAGARHDQIKIGAAAAGNERLGAVEQKVIVPALRADLQTCGIRARVRLSEAVAGELRHAAEIGKKPSPQLPRAVSIDHP